MKIIKRGRPQKSWAKQFICTGTGNGGGGCGAVLLVEADDLYQTHSSSYDGSTDYFTTFRCVCCKVETDVKVPSNIKIGKKEKHAS